MIQLNLKLTIYLIYREHCLLVCPGYTFFFFIILAVTTSSSMNLLASDSKKFAYSSSVDIMSFLSMTSSQRVPFLFMFFLFLFLYLSLSFSRTTERGSAPMYLLIPSYISPQALLMVSSNIVLRRMTKQAFFPNSSSCLPRVSTML